MSSKAITEKQDERGPGRPAPGGPPPEVLELAPSVVREDQPTLPRALGMFGAAAVVFGGMALGFNLWGRAVPRVGMSGSILFLAIGLCGLLFHAAFDRDVQFRRLYLIFGFVTLALGVVLSLLPYPNKVGDQLRWATPCLVLALMFLVSVLRNEEDAYVRDLSQKFLAGTGLMLAIIGLGGGLIRTDFFLPLGLVLSLVALLYLTAFIGSRGISDDLGYYTGVGMAVLGGLIILYSLGRSLFFSGGTGYFTTAGGILLVVGMLYAGVGAALYSDSAFMVLIRREMGSFFYSPLAYLTLFGFVIFSWIAYLGFVDQLIIAAAQNVPLTEPIVQSYFFGLFPVFTAVVVVPVLTMRLLSEEHRTGTLEVLLTAPVNEVTVVLSKFAAALLTYVIMWLPYGLFLITIPLSGGSTFDYRPLLSFAVVMTVTGAAFVSGGLFFSSLTKSQVASGVLTGAFMMLLTFLYFPAAQASRTGETTGYALVFKHMSYLHVWYSSLDGILTPKYLLFPLSLTVLFLFMTVQVLESRKWR